VTEMTSGEIAGLIIGIIGVVLTIYFGIEQGRRKKTTHGRQPRGTARQWLLPALGGLALLSGIYLWTPGSTPTGVYVEKFTAVPDTIEQEYLRAKIERNIVEYLFSHGISVFSQNSSSPSTSRSDKIISGRLSASPDNSKVAIEVSYSEKGKLLGSASVEGPRDIVSQIDHSIPDVVFNSPGFSMNGALKQEPISRLTRAPYAFALYYEAKKRTQTEEYADANNLLDKTLDASPNFAEAYWARGTLAAKEGNTALADEKYAKAAKADKEHYKVSILSNQTYPLPFLRAELLSSSWRALQPGLQFKELILKEYNIHLLLWRADLGNFALHLAKAITARGNSVSEIRELHDATLAANGGFFEMDADNRLLPSGLLIINGKMLSPYNDANKKLTGVLAVTRDKVQIINASPTIDSSQYIFAVQSGPRLVEADGRMGIYGNDWNRQERTAICISGNLIIVAIIKGSGLSLYEFASLLIEKVKDGGPECTVALNLDGGPSSQASYKSPSGSVEIPGLWKIDNALLLVKRGPNTSPR
jgi:uncharacterized protein YigE (DUF2233 family)